MSEEDVRGGLMDAITDEPPLAFDPDDIIAAARKQTRRRALVAAGLATVVIAVAAVAVPVVLGGSSTTPVAEQPSSTQRPSTTAEPAESNVEQLRQRSEEMSAHLRATIPETLPEASDFTFGEFGGEASGEFYPDQTSVNAPIDFTIDGERYSIVINSFLPGGNPQGPAEVCVVQCKDLGRQANGALYSQTEDYGESVITTVFHFRDTGAVVTINAYNYEMTDSAPVYQPTVPVTMAQLTTIATDPELEL